MLALVMPRYQRLGQLLLILQVVLQLTTLEASRLAVVEEIPIIASYGTRAQTLKGLRLFSRSTRDTQHQQQQEQQDKLNINYETKWFRQPVDHFSWANQDTWLQRYLVNRDSCASYNCPILFYTGNEGDIEVFTNNTGFMWENAKTFKAMLVFAEHRFYGQSMPYKIDPTTISPNETKTLGYLSSEQALADFARLIYEIKNSLYDAQYSPVIAIGGSYGGMLSAWMRMKYPNVITGALAGSAPILQFPGEYDCQKFQSIVTKDFQDYSANCSKSIGKSWSVMRDFGRASQMNLATMSEVFNTCQTMSREDVDSLISLLEGIWVNMAMTDYANEASFLSKMPARPILHACKSLDKDPDELSEVELLQRISAASQIYTNYTKQTKCLDIQKLLFDPMDVLWGFQACTEMVMPICSDGVRDMFDPEPFDLRAYVDDCRNRWGVQTQVNKVKTLYGVEDDALAASNIIFSSGTRDPWSAGCPTRSNEKNGIHAISIEGACHHEDLRASGSNDTVSVKQARLKEINIITDWIERHYEQVSHGNSKDNVISSFTAYPAWIWGN